MTLATETGFVLERGRPTIDKAPGASLLYGLDLSAWEVLSSDTITAATVTVGGTLTAGAAAVNAGVITALISGGTVGHTLPATFAWTTAGGATDSRTIWLRIVDR